ncbi:Uma2 family endonuclease [Desulfosporosinus sp. SYSU MS00001]|uniref:Uma2 family endonuclease n=1 Tax=Desulfosporosinus sp. SYSU MS00001 TaxID=3416284 RepID=UPI003CF91635
MALVKARTISYEDFLKLREASNDKVEFIDNIVYMTPAPSPLHQRICFQVAKILDGHFTDKNYQMLQGVNIRFLDDEKRKIGDVIPDITVVCGNNDINSTFIEEIPVLIVEVVSPSSVYADNIEKAALYKRSGVKEYWIIDPKSKCITVWNFVSDEQMIYHDVARSYLFEGLSVELSDIFV